ncbi:MAG: AzlC family ABC transporter permease [Clostridia bacterium]|nr:AzlC family ABC transporter permease [Clostridia bacterium]
MTGFLFLGTSYGIYMRVSGFPWYYPALMAMTIFAGSMEFVAVNLLLSPFNPLGALVLTLMVNARHLFYGLAMLEKYKNTGLKKLYLIFGLCDETFSINCTIEPPKHVDRSWFMFFVTLLNQCYWVMGATLGGVFGSLIAFNAKGLDFVMTALLLVIFLENWLKERNHWSSLIGLAATALSLLVFGASSFIIPAMLLIIAVLTLLRAPLEGAVSRP